MLPNHFNKKIIAILIIVAFLSSIMILSCSQESRIIHGLSAEYPLINCVNRFLEDQQIARSFSPSGLTPQDYLSTISSIVDYFKQYQNDQGAIIDPFEHQEKQYSTPAFALCAAVLYTSGYRQDAQLLEAADRAMDHATRTLVAGQAADGHGDFFTIKLMYTYRLLKEVLPQAKVQQWSQLFNKMHPDTSYRSTLSKREPSRIHNWNLVGTSGEFLRYQLGLSSDRSFVEKHLPIHLTRITQHGMYVDPHNPMAYDLFARYHLLLMLANGYDGIEKESMENLSLRGAWTSLIIQSPCGEVPCGCRSAHHQWNEALECAIFEIYARRYAEEKQFEIAGAFKRGACLALESIHRWLRPTGELWIVKNRHHPSERWGYEGYSFHSQYNLLAASMLAIAYLHADPTIKEQPSPADIGGFCVSIDDGNLKDAGALGFHKTFANSGGYYLEIERAGNHRYNPTGLLRLHRRVDEIALRGISDGSVNTALYAKANWGEKDVPFTHAIGPGWLGSDGKWVKLADLDENELLGKSSVKVLAEKPEQVEFVVEYQIQKAGCETVSRHYKLTPEKLSIMDELTGDIKRIRTYVTFLISDGENSADVQIDSLTLTSKINDVVQTYRILQPTRAILVKNLTVSDIQPWVLAPFRNGTLGAVAFEIEGNKLAFEIRLNQVKRHKRK